MSSIIRWGGTFRDDVEGLVCSFNVRHGDCLDVSFCRACPIICSNSLFYIFCMLVH